MEYLAEIGSRAPHPCPVCGAMVRGEWTNDQKQMMVFECQAFILDEDGNETKEVCGHTWVDRTPWLG